MLYAERAKVRCRQIEVSDLDSVSSLLAGAFPPVAKKTWSDAFKRLQDRPVPDGFPRFGYMLENEGAAVGVLILICTKISRGGSHFIRCNVSSWYAEPPYRSLAPLLVTRAMRHQPATYINISPAPNTWPIVEAQGFSRISCGTFFAMPAITPQFGTAKIKKYSRTQDLSQHLSVDDIALLADHDGYGCLCLVCETAEGAYPIIFRRRVLRGVLPVAQLIYCPSLDALTRAAGPLGRYLLRRGLLLMLIRAAGTLPLPGRYSHKKGLPVYCRGEDKPWAGDLAYTESALFGM